MSQRASRREKRRQARRRQQIRNIAIIAGIALVLAGLLIYPSLQPVGDIVEITPKQRPLAEGLAIGDPNAPVTMEVFEDFQCPACKNFTDTIEPQIIETYVNTGQVRMVYRQNPFIGNESLQASNASMCANEQGRFWDFHDILFANQTGENIGAFSNKRLQAFAESLNLDMQAFNACFQQNTYEDQINADRQLGLDYGVRGTPTVVVNGEMLQTFAFNVVQTAIETALATSGP